MRILLTNDDGILAPGLAAMYQELVQIGDVDVAAPDSVQSAAGHAITLHGPLSAKKIHAHNAFYGWAIGGRPADCVKLAVSQLLKHRPDMVVSGINDGANVAVNVLYSGTVAAAAEGAILGLPAVAVSLEWGDELNFERAACIAGRIVSRYAAAVKLGRPPCPLLNVNIPNCGGGWPLGIRVAPQSVQKVEDTFTVTSECDGISQYQLSGWFNEFGPPEYDLGALRDGYVVLTPLHFDMTDHERLGAVRGMDWPDVTTE
jgi:5'-nucleotidase